MMRYDIRHVTRFDYGQPVSFARCNLRLRPILWSGQTLESYDLSVEPGGRTTPAQAPAGLANVVRLMVDSPTRTLAITSSARMTVERAIPAPRDDDPSLIEVARMARDNRNGGPSGPAAYLYPSPRIPLDADIADWCAHDLDPGSGVPAASIALAQRIQRDFAFDPTATLVDTEPHDAFAKRGGVCQDFAQIMISGLRAAGIPAAYVSGYLRTLPPPGEERLVGADASHAWVLVWCGPDRGWIGVDPTNGIWMAEDHIVVAIGRDYGDIAPIDGVMLGSGAQTMTVSVDVAPID